MRAWKTHLRRISHVMHNYLNFHTNTESVAGPKNYPWDSKPHNQKKKKFKKVQGFLAFDAE